jgi:hypothetical protein
MKKLTVNQMEITKGGKFMGNVEECTPCSGGHHSCRSRFYIFWIKVSDSGWNEYPC